MFDKVIDDGTLRATPEGFSVGVRLPWYRSLPLSCISVNLLTCDGHPVPAEAITIHLNGRARQLWELVEEIEETWFITDTATLSVKGAPLASGSEHRIEAEIEVRPPYIKGLRRVGRVARMMKAA